MAIQISLLTVTVLHEDSVRLQDMTLEEIVEEATNGAAISPHRPKIISTVTLTDAQARAELTAADADPNFFDNLT
jgi:hypothetical protein